MSEDYAKDFLFGQAPQDKKSAPPVYIKKPSHDPYLKHKIIFGGIMGIYFLVQFFSGTKTLAESLKENSVLLVLILISLTIHECSHAWMAYNRGDPTAKNEGRISLNPLVHIDWLGLILFFLGGLGWAKPVPVNSSNLKDSERDKGMILISFAGPASNIFLGILGCFFLKFGFPHVVGALAFSSLLRELFVMFSIGFIYLNFGLAYLNLVPIPPLDGSHVVKHLLPPSQRNIIESIEDVGEFILLTLISTRLLGMVINPLVNGTVKVLFTLLAINP